MNFIKQDQRIFAENEAGNLLAEVTFPEESPGCVNINHTFVDDSLRGQGIADKLLHAVVEQLQLQSKKAVLSCSYAVRWFEKHPEHGDLLK